MRGSRRRRLLPMSPLYLDNNATTQILPEVLEAMMPFLTGYYANASSGYRFARTPRRAVDTAREQVAALLGADPTEIVFTSGGTEADNTALASAALARPGRRGIVHSSVEHPAVESFSKHLTEHHGCSRTIIPVSHEGVLDLDQLDAALDPAHTAVLSLMWANNETGVLLPVPEAARFAASRGVYFHTDAVQAIGKTPVSVRDSGIHFLALSAHKFHGPKGAGALYASSQVRLRPRITGGAQENGRRGGTENVPGIVGLGKAAELARLRLEAGESQRLRNLRDRFEGQLMRELDGVAVNGHPGLRLPNTANLAFSGVDAAALLMVLDDAGICASGGSACHTGSVHPSPVLTAMGISTERALSSVRFSLSCLTTESEIDQASIAVVKAVSRLRSLRDQSSPVIRASPSPR
ncbi:MAG TPA: aminotransferase class V-fold PLP-dependent enzyme [Verrucomicrobiales bacterium]|nr:aminotransferase class V-fold PLP-dependent enzyme [Verrucomicrobiales bacterium]